MNKILTLISDTAKSYCTRKNIFRFCVALVLSCILSVFLKIRFPYCIRWTVPSFLFCNVVCISLILRYFDALFCKSRKQFLYVGGYSLIVFCCFISSLKTLSHPDVQNNCFEISIESGEIEFDGPVSQDSTQFSSGYFIISSNDYVVQFDGWKKKAYSFTRKEDGMQKKLVFILSSSMIHDLSLRFALKGISSGISKAIISVNGKKYPLTLENGKTLYYQANDTDLFHSDTSINIIYLLIGIIGCYILSYLLCSCLDLLLKNLFLYEKCDHRIILNFLFVVAFFIVISANYWSCVSSDFYAFLNNQSDTWHTKMIDYWWHIAMFLLPVRQMAGAFVIAFVISFFIGFRLLLKALLETHFIVSAYLMFFSLWGILYVKSFPGQLICADQILAGMTMLALGLFVMIFDTQILIYRVLGSILIAICIAFIILVRQESITVALPIAVIAASIWVKRQKKHFLYLSISVILAIFFCISIFAIYKFYYSPIVLHENKYSRVYYNLFRESIAMSYLSNDWVMPEWVNEDAFALIDKENYMSRVADVISLMPDVTQEQYKKLWLDKIKQHPKEYFLQKWISYSWLWATCTISITKVTDHKQMKNSSQYGLSFRDFFRDGLFAFYIILPSWLKQLSIILVSFFSSIWILFYKSRNKLIYLIWAISCSGLAHLLAFFAINAAPNYRYILWIDISGTLSIILLLVLIITFFKRYWNVLSYKNSSCISAEVK